MGCPDWPKCFGKWVPPTSVTELPEDYETTFAEKRLSKNVRLAGYLELLGYDQLADKLVNDPAIEEEQPFNATKTWIEYINRLIGVIIGLLIIGTVVASVKYLKTDARVFYLALASFILVVFQGWLGSIVVSTNLLPGMVTTHMLLALLIVVLLINAVYISFGSQTNKGLGIPSMTSWIIMLAMIISVIQVVLGTQVREALDVIAVSMEYKSRESWIAQAGSIFPIHRSYSILIVLINGFILYTFWKYRNHKLVLNTSLVLASVIFLSVITGMIMAYLGIAKFAQPVHLLLGTLLLGVQYVLFLISRKNKAVA